MKPRVWAMTASGGSQSQVPPDGRTHRTEENILDNTEQAATKLRMTSDQDLNGNYQFLATTHFGAEKHITDTAGTQQNPHCGKLQSERPSFFQTKTFSQDREETYTALEREI